MKIAFGIVFLTLAPVFAFGAQVVKLVREPGVLAFSLQKGYGVQRDGKHELVVSSVATGEIIKSIKVFKGAVAPEDKKYFSRLEAAQLPEVKGKIRITGRIFYCSFEQKFCSVQKIDQEL